MSATPEFAVIDILRERCAAHDVDSVAVGIGDDAAITRIADGCELVTATDALIEGTHFLPGAAARSIGHRCLAVNLSDLAAMGARPRWATLALSLPEFDASWVRAFADGFADLAAAHQVTLIGGDTVRGPLGASVTLMGEVQAGEAITRSGARVGDAIYVTGAPGCAGAGCAIRLGQESCSREDEYLQCFEFPIPRVVAGVALRGLATAMIDVSDGVATDLQRLLVASGVGAVCTVPESTRLESDFGRQQAAAYYLQGGEDYELLFTVSSDADTTIQQLFAQLDVPVTQLGQVESEVGLRWTNMAGITPASFEHFKESAG